MKGAFRDTTSTRGKGFVVNYLCKRIDCEDCRRRKAVSNLRQAGAVILHAGAALVHVALVPWRRWRSVSRTVERYCGRAGYVRVRHDTGLTLVVSAKPFPGTTAMTPNAACGMAADAIERADKVHQAAAWCGRWKRTATKRDAKYQPVEIKLNDEAVEALAVEYKAKLRRLKGGAVGVSWIFAPDADPGRVEEFYRRLACRTSDVFVEEQKQYVSGATMPDFTPSWMEEPADAPDTSPPPRAARMAGTV